MQIPKLIHFVWWQGRDKIPVEIRNNVELWREANKNWKIKIWDKNDIFAFILEKYPWLIDFYSWQVKPSGNGDFKYMRHVDFARPLIAESFGGLVVDMDMTPNRKVDEFLSDKVQYFRTYPQITPKMLKDKFKYVEPLDISNKSLIMFYDFKAPDGKYCLAPGVIFAEPNNGITKWFVLWAMQRDMNAPVIDCFGPRAWKDFICFLQKKNAMLLKRMLVMSHFYVWWNDDYSKAFNGIQSFALMNHGCMKSWCDGSISKPWEAK
jgi:hypothetical protein